MKIKISISLAFAGLLFVAACAKADSKAAANDTTTAAVSTTQQPVDDAPRISLTDAKRDYDAGAAMIVDVRDVNAYKNEHVEGAVNIPLANLETSMDKIPKDKKIIVYCS